MMHFSSPPTASASTSNLDLSAVTFHVAQELYRIHKRVETLGGTLFHVMSDVLMISKIICYKF